MALVYILESSCYEITLIQVESFVNSFITWRAFWP